uniref:uncharacterized protein LOC122587559 n=1 Tax=Erigeron canadensis TaxID=72917 RepID=UPI001CB91DED|nr:uncharacterized protein LOC122587559 [Erigeron canadensis]
MEDKQVDGRGRVGYSTIQKCVCAICQLAYGYNPDSLDEYLEMGEETSRCYLDYYCKCVFELYRDEYLHRPTPEDIQRLYARHEELHGFPGMLGSIDCMHWPWKNYPKAWQGQFTRGDHGHPTIMLEAVASYNREIKEDRAPDTSFTVNGTHYKKGYYLANDIYLEWSTFVKSYSCPQDEKCKKFKMYQESVGKDVERAFGGLQNSWHILTQPSRSKIVNRITQTIYTCVILHNINVEDARYAISSLEKGDDNDQIVLPERTF